MPDEIKPVKRYSLYTDRETGGQMEETSYGQYVDLSDYEALRRSSISLDTAQELAGLLTEYRKQVIHGGEFSKRIDKALARFNAEKGGQG